MPKSANGTTFAFGSTDIGTVASISREDTGAEIDITGLADTEKTYEAGQLDSKLTVTCYGAPADVYGESAAITIVYASGGSESIGTYVSASRYPDMQEVYLSVMRMSGMLAGGDDDLKNG